MEKEVTVVEQNNAEKVDFTYPEGFKKAAAQLDFLPEEARETVLKRFAALAFRF